jgi:hypothetical protein
MTLIYPETREIKVGTSPEYLVLSRWNPGVVFAINRLGGSQLMVLREIPEALKHLPIHETQTHHGPAIIGYWPCGLAQSPDGRHLYTFSHCDRTFRVIDVETALSTPDNDDPGIIVDEAELPRLGRRTTSQDWPLGRTNPRYQITDTLSEMASTPEGDYHLAMLNEVGEIHLIRTVGSQAEVVFSYSLLPIVEGPVGPGRMQAVLITTNGGLLHNPISDFVTIWVFLKQFEHLETPGPALVRFVVNGATGDVINWDVGDYHDGIEQYDLDLLYRAQTGADSTSTAQIQDHYNTHSIFIDPHDDLIYVGNTVWQLNQELDFIARPMTLRLTDAGQPLVENAFHKVIAAPSPGTIIAMRCDLDGKVETLLKYTVAGTDYDQDPYWGPQLRNPMIRSGTALDEEDGDLTVALSQPYAARVYKYNLNHYCGW